MADRRWASPVHNYADGRTVRESCLADVEVATSMCLGHRYGQQPARQSKISITHLEYRRARAKGIETIALLKTSIPDVAVAIYDLERYKNVEACGS